MLLILLASLTFFYSANACGVLSDVNGCSVPFGLNIGGYKTQFTPACLNHDVCYRCGIMYGWSQFQCDDGFKQKMYAICKNSPASLNAPQELTGTFRKIYEISKKIKEFYKKATANGTTKDEAKRLWEAAKLITKLAIKWMFEGEQLKKCQYAADIFYESVAAFGKYKYRSQAKSHCSEACAKKLGYPY